MTKQQFAAFLALGTVAEIGLATGRISPLVNLFYLLSFVYVVLLLIFGRRPTWIWYQGFTLIGYVSFASLLFQLLDIYTSWFRTLDGCVCALVYFSMMVKLQKTENDEDSSMDS